MVVFIEEHRTGGKIMAMKVGTKVAVKDDAFQVAHVVIGQEKTVMTDKNGDTVWGPSGRKYRNEWHVQNLTDGSLATYHINEIEEWN